jgi:hypothetical protein
MPRPTTRFTDVLPIAGSIACALKATDVDKRLHQQERVPVVSLPIGAEPAEVLPENPRGQIRLPDKHQEPTIVRDQMKVAAFG